VTGPDDALFALQGAHVVPGDAARGPWDPEALHGGPVAALVARAVEACEPDPAMHVARLTLELLRPVPVVPLTVESVMTRPGRKVQLVEVTITAGDVICARGRGVRIRTHAGDDPAGEGLAVSDGPVPGSGEGAPDRHEDGQAMPSLREGYRAFHNSGAELLFVGGTFAGAGPATVWVRLAVPVVPGESPSPAQRAAAAADFGNGVSSVLDFERYLFINPDLTVYLARPPVGEWVCLEASTRLGTPGVGVAESRLWDAHGIVGRSVQSLVVERRR
jgi:hypothetical protein